MTKLEGNPNKQNASGESALHLVCQEDSPRNERKERRAICLNLMLQLSYHPFISPGDKLSLDCLDNVRLVLFIIRVIFEIYQAISGIPLGVVCF